MQQVTKASVTVKEIEAGAIQSLFMAAVDVHVYTVWLYEEIYYDTICFSSVHVTIDV